jgi:hypothetical protein
MKRTWRLVASAAAAVAVSVLGVLPASAAGSRPADTPPTATAPLSISALSFDAKTVDASSGSAVVVLSWTMHASNPEVSSFVGEAHLRRMDARTGAYIGTELAVNFASQGSLDPSVTARPGGTAAATTLDWTVAVPQYGATGRTTWAVSEIAAADGIGDSIDWTAPQLSRFPRTFVARTTPDGDTPALDRIETDYSMRDTVYDDPQRGTLLVYEIDSHEAESGVYAGSVVATGPGGRQARGSFAVTWNWSDGYRGCGNVDWLEHYVDNCQVIVPLPGGLPEGDWTVTEVDLTSNAGVTHAYTELTGPTTHVTSDAVLSASDFAFTPAQVDSWHYPTPTAQFALRPSGAAGGAAGITSVEITDWGNTGQCLQLSTEPTVQGDGTVTVPVSADPGEFTCQPAGLIVTDAAGDRAVYGSLVGAPDIGATLTNIPDTVLPTIDSASLSPSSVASDDHSTWIALTVDLAGSTAGVKGIDIKLVDGAGQTHQVLSAGLSATFSGPFTQYFELPQDTAPGTYTVGFVLDDAARQSVSYGLPDDQSLPVPGGPVTLTVTAPQGAGAR